MVLKLENVNKAYGSKKAVDNLNLKVPTGSIYGIIGPNGAGKTTTIRMIMNIIAPDSGTILFNDKPVDALFKNKVGYLPEERGLYKKMSVKEVILYLGQLKTASRSDINNAMDGYLERMNLLDYKNSKVEELSKGMQQKLQFITTLIHDPEILILDELFSGLDPINIELIKDVILEFKQKGRTVLFSTHVMEQAEKLVDNICMISGGQKVLDGPLHEVKGNYGKNTVQLEIEGDGSFLKGLPGVVKVTDFTNYYELTLSDMRQATSLLKAIIEKVRVNRFEIIEPSLYNLFIEKASPSREDIKQLGDPGAGRVGQ